jgi:hypothetical protein
VIQANDFAPMPVTIHWSRLCRALESNNSTTQQLTDTLRTSNAPPSADFAGVSLSNPSSLAALDAASAKLFLNFTSADDSFLLASLGRDSTGHETIRITDLTRSESDPLAPKSSAVFCRSSETGGRSGHARSFR